jgi:predicted dehydrogenase
MGSHRVVTKLLVVGSGSIGSRHARNAKALGVDALAVFDRDAGRRGALAAEVGAHEFPTLEAALGWGPTAAVICTPPVDHIPTSRACAAAGCHLLIEKPLAASLDGLDDLTRLVARLGLGVSVAYQLRFHPAIARMRELVKSGTIGRLLSVRAEYGQYLPAWRPSRDYRETYTAQAGQGGGILLDASHEIDYVRWIAGEPTALYGCVGRLSDLDMDAEDTAALVIRFADRVIAEIHLDCVRRGYRRGCTLIGSEATVHWDSAKGLHLTLADGSTTDEPIAPDANAPYVAELDAFLRCPDASGPMATLADGRRVLDLVLAAREASASRREIAV